MKVEERILQRIEKNRDEIISFVREIVSTPSVTGEEKAVGAAVYRKMEKIGLDELRLVEAIPGRPNIVGVLRGGNPGKDLLFNGHLDVVPPGPEEEWDHPPFAGVIEGGYLHGRGSVDMKSGLCGSILAVEALKQENIPFSGSITLTAVCDEQIGGALGIRHLIEKGYVKGDMGINCEATNLDTVDVAHKGIYQCDITIQGKAIHGSRPWLGINAIDKASSVIEEIKKLARELEGRKHPLLRFPTVNVSTIHGGTAANMIPSKCTMEVNRRLIPGETFEQVERELQDILDRLAKDDPQFKATLKAKDFFMPVMDTSPEAPVVKAIQKAHKMVRGNELPTGGKDAGTDAAWIVNATGMPMPIYGPGDYLKGSLASNEKIALEDIVDAVKVYALAAYYLLGKGE